MPSDPTILGFGNPWYEHAIRTTRKHALADDLDIPVVTAPGFLATKLAAYEGRGGGDLLLSHDMEDVVNVVAFRPELPGELGHEPGELRHWVAAKISEHLILDPLAEAAVSGNLSDARIAPDRVPRTMARIRSIADLGSRSS